MACPACGGDCFGTAVPAAEIADEVRVRDELIRERVARLPAGAVLRDRVAFAQSEIVDILSCRRCGLLMRDIRPDTVAPRYERDCYGGDELSRMFEAYVEEFRKKEPACRPLLPRGAEVLEVGSYVGAFLHVAGEWGWRATGVDIGREVSDFAVSRGLASVHAPLESCRFAPDTFDAVFVWNCFEQAPDLASLVSAVRRVLKPDGLLVVRTPNAAFYLSVRAFKSGLAAEALADQSMLGFPFFYGFHLAALNRLMVRHAFTSEGLLEAPASHWSEARSAPEKGTLQAALQKRDLPPAALPPWLEGKYRKRKSGLDAS